MAPLVVDPSAYLKPHHSVGHCPRGVLEHLQYADLRQVQPNCHNIASHRGTPGSLTLTSPIPAGPRPLLRDPQPPRSPHFREGSQMNHIAQAMPGRRLPYDEQIAA